MPIDNSLHAFDLDKQAWFVEIAKGNAPPPRLGVTLVAVGETLYIFGGAGLSCLIEHAVLALEGLVP